MLFVKYKSDTFLTPSKCDFADVHLAFVRFLFVFYNLLEYCLCNFCIKYIFVRTSERRIIKSFEIYIVPLILIVKKLELF